MPTQDSKLGELKLIIQALYLSHIRLWNVTLPLSKKSRWCMQNGKECQKEAAFHRTYSLLSSRVSSVLADQSFSRALRHKHTHTKLGISLCPLEDKSPPGLSNLVKKSVTESVGTSEVNSALKAWNILTHVSTREYPLEALLHWTLWDTRSFYGKKKVILFYLLKTFSCVTLSGKLVLQENTKTKYKFSSHQIFYLITMSL